MSLPTVSARKAQELLARGAVLVDIREPAEHARERILGARLHPLSQIDGISGIDGAPVIFHCRSGGRTASASARLKAAAPGEAFVLEGGLDAWKRAGLPVIVDRRQPIEMMRQVQIAAGTLILLGVVLGGAVDPLFYGLSGFVGAGLVFAGISGTCGMARLLALAPWNRRTAVPSV